MVDVEQLVAGLQKPKIGDVLRLTQWLVKRMSSIQIADAVDVKNTGVAVLGSVIGVVEDEDLLELGKILLGDAGKDLTVDDLELWWMSEALAIWFEKVDFPRVLKNAKRIAAAVK